MCFIRRLDLGSLLLGQIMLLCYDHSAVSIVVKSNIHVTMVESKLCQVCEGHGRSFDFFLALISIFANRNILCFSWVALSEGRNSFLPFKIIKEYECSPFQSYLHVGKLCCSG